MERQPKSSSLRHKLSFQQQSSNSRSSFMLNFPCSEHQKDLGLSNHTTDTVVAMDELIWAAAWLYNATKLEKYQNYIFQNMSKLEAYFSNGSFSEFGWDNKHAGINVLISKLNMTDTESSHLFLSNADKLVCSLLPNSGTSSASFLQGGLLFKQGGSSLEHATALSFLLLVYGRTLGQTRRQVHCGETIVTPERLTEFARGQVDYILGNNPLGISFMVGYGKKYPQRIRHKGSSLPSKSTHPKRIDCKEGLSYYNSSDPNPNLVIGAVVGGPDINGVYDDSRDSMHSEPKMYINAPLVGVLAYLKIYQKSRYLNLVGRGPVLPLWQDYCGGRGVTGGPIVGEEEAQSKSATRASTKSRTHPKINLVVAEVCFPVVGLAIESNQFSFIPQDHQKPTPFVLSTETFLLKLEQDPPPLPCLE
ncbi:hypothetical protein SLEP1_g25116 [Rubroshorea leprosula]|uniref:cellulase n=1 Tax=Rubroshorea leprosula TaxID=152421 RepID=A0AAV5JHX4_9ROSI|nr:hypothetical protein SLEP1_g25116 [Rubroshorea leprosula]